MTLPVKTYRRTRTIYVIGDVAFVANPSTRTEEAALIDARAKLAPPSDPKETLSP